MARRGSFRELRSRVERAGWRIRVGVVGPDAGQVREDTDLTNGEIATIHEYGSEPAGIPERSFLRRTIRERMGALRRLRNELTRRIIAGTMDPRTAANIVGLWLANAVKGRIVDGLDPPLSPTTIARRARSSSGEVSTKPLIDSAQLVNSITWVVED